jgi:hypothetical protein
MMPKVLRVDRGGAPGEGVTVNERQIIASLEDSGAEAAQQKKTLKAASEYLEESYILNLPLSPALRRALEAFARRPTTTAPLAAQARRLVKRYAA